MKNIIVDSHQDLYCAIHDETNQYKKQTNITQIKNNIKIVHASIFIEPDIFNNSSVFDLQNETEKQLNFYLELIKDDDDLELILDYDDVKNILQNNKTGVIIHFEGAESIYDLEYLQKLYDKGLRSVGLTWNRINNIGVPATMNSTDGLFDFGKMFVKKMIELNMIIDVAHLNFAGIDEVYELCKQSNYTFINSHVGVYELQSVDRNIIDRHIKAIDELEGVIGISIGQRFLSNDNVTNKNFIEHIKYCKNIGSIEVLGIGTDLGGITGGKMIDCVNCTDDIVNVIDPLLEELKDSSIVKKILGENYINYYKKIWETKN